MKMGHDFLVAREFGSSRSRNFSSYADHTAFLADYKLLKPTERHMHEVIPPNRTAMLAFDHDCDGGLDQLQTHNSGICHLREMLFDLLGLEPQPSVLLTSHRTKADGNDYLSTHQRFPRHSRKLEWYDEAHYALAQTYTTRLRWYRFRCLRELPATACSRLMQSRIDHTTVACRRI